MNKIALVLATVLLCSNSAQAKVPIAEIGKNKIKLEVAQTKEQIERGLMFRTSLPEDQGMIFLFRPPRPVRFWMFNCNISLDMCFIRDGKIVKISHNVPPCKSRNPQDCPLYPVDGEIEASEVLELSSGYCERHSVKEGDSIKFDLPGKASKSESNSEAEKTELKK
jgi:uncharacterized membrane protein (UPF0127 family)